MNVNPLIEKLKKALKLKDLTITSWSKTLRNPKGDTIDRTSVYKAVERNSPEWLMKEIHAEIRQSKQKFPGYWKKVSQRR